MYNVKRLQSLFLGYYVPIELTMIMKSLKVLYHIDGNCNEKFVDRKVKCTSREISSNNWGVNKTCLCWPIWVPVYHSFQKRVRTTPLSVRIITEISVNHRASAFCLAQKILRS